MAKVALILSFLFYTSYCYGQLHISNKQTAGCCKSKYTEKQWDTLDINKLRAEYKRLKRARCEECDAFGSDYHAIMEVLGKELAGKTKKQVAKIMGPPDFRKEGKYIYFWRGWHDYLYFTFPSGKAVPKWYMALE